MKNVLYYIRWSLALLIFILAAGCASSSTAVIDEEIVTNIKPMNVYKSLIIRDFEVKPEFSIDDSEAGMDKRQRRYAAVPSQLSGQILRYVTSRRIYQSVSRTEVPTATSLVLSGKFTRMGRFRISIEATLTDGQSGIEVAYFRQTLWDIVDTTEGIGRLAHEIADFIDRIQYK
ncbi:hypothetical protein [Pelotalea chapellei]|uniref:ABC-type transport auxiliary lipoprotein component domain-containing protein n=1 Tax=Pelotalea chapellei TaxID=44671 RepID=A0ABS5U7U4_9BACT|nr:hypothetical protein [Pelotalea chapellei]MBT1071744.1 hypothetical protein [Pelotalea chapellei]